MAIASFRAGSTRADSVSTTVTITKPTGTADGDLLVVALQSDSSHHANSVPAGWTETLVGGGTLPSHGTLDTYYKIASSEGASWDWGYAASSGHILGACAAYKDIAGLATDLSQEKNTSSATSLTTDALNNSQANVLVIYAGAVQDFSAPLGGMQPITYDAAVTPDISKDNTGGDNDKIVWIAHEIQVVGNVPARTFSWPGGSAASVISNKPVLAEIDITGDGWGWIG